MSAFMPWFYANYIEPQLLEICEGAYTNDFAAVTDSLPSGLIPSFRRCGEFTAIHAFFAGSSHRRGPVCDGYRNHFSTLRDTALMAGPRQNPANSVVSPTVDPKRNPADKTETSHSTRTVRALSFFAWAARTWGTPS